MRAPGPVLATTLLLLSGCAPEPAKPDVDASISSAVGQVLHPTRLYVTYLEPTNTLVVFDQLGGLELGRVLAVPGGRLPVSLEGRPCELQTNGTSVRTDSVEPATNPVAPPRNTAPPRERRTTEASVTLHCADGPVPGIEPTPSVGAWAVMPWLVGALLVGLLAGFLFWRGDERDGVLLQLLGMALLLGVLLAALILSWQAMNGALVLSVPLLAVAVSGSGFVATLLAARNPEARARAGAGGVVVGALVGPGVIAVAFPLWAAGAPLAACGILLAIALVSAIVAVSG